MTDQPLTVALDPHPAGPTVLRVVGELDHHTTRQVREVLDTIPFARDAGLVIDATDLAYCDSTGISLLVTTYQRAQAAGSRFALAGLSRELTRLLQIVGLDKILPLHPTVDDAVNAQRS
ncbi:STAS domain-containing protein [Saccharothrix sp. S26]|uniref:STAS domain-containing protein n=1 Tax=Saccharothrix sp. S26 TaxID=2907215 RepID=UPI001F475662|nr:STAS domain-containing protein [Saccharothrix sp. S26]MCE6998334.1 STAS domain-containing protein [Saccharothrix sp. S26]